MYISVSTFILIAVFLTYRIPNQSLQTCKHQYQPRKTATISLKHHPRRVYRWLQWHHQWRSVEYATVRQSQTNLWFLLVCVLALCSMFIRAVCRDGLRVQTQRNVNCVNMSSAWNPRWSPSQRLVMLNYLHVRVCSNRFWALALCWIRSLKGLTLETSAFESLYSDQFILSTQLIKPNYLVILLSDAAPQFP